MIWVLRSHPIASSSLSYMCAQGGARGEWEGPGNSHVIRIVGKQLISVPAIIEAAFCNTADVLRHNALGI
jgi:hypothetical protein